MFAQEAGLQVTVSSDLSKDVRARVREAVHAGDIKTGEKRLVCACMRICVYDLWMQVYLWSILSTLRFWKRAESCCCDCRCDLRDSFMLQPPTPTRVPHPSLLLQLQRFVELLRPGAAGVEQALAFAQDTLAPLVQVLEVMVVVWLSRRRSLTSPQENPEFLPDMESCMCAALVPLTHCFSMLQLLLSMPLIARATLHLSISSAGACWLWRTRSPPRSCTSARGWACLVT